MRRPLSIATFVLLMASAPVWAQRGGGHGGGGFGGHGGGFSGHAGGFHAPSGGGFARGGMRSPSGFAGHSFNRAPSSSFRGPVARQPFLHNPALSARGFGNRGIGNCGFRGRRDRDFDFRFRNGWGWGWGWPWWYGGLYDPSWWWDSGSDYDPDYRRNLDIAYQMNQQSLDEQRARDQDSEQDSVRPPMRPPESYHVQSEAPVPPTVLVFRDQHKLEVENYAIVGQTLWNFAPQRTQKIPISDLDIPATVKANDERGVQFHVPGEGQSHT